MTARSALRNIPLNKLVLSPTNVRKTPSSAAEDAELEASIRASGLKQSLVVHPMGDAKDLHAVVAGGRRLKVLQKLAAEGALPAGFKVPCLVEEPEAALETSLIENTIRSAMHPADEFVAMASLIDAGEAIEAVATRFGVSERHVRQRLRLGKLAPELLDAYRAGEIGLEVVTAFTLGTDHAAQLAIWRQVKGNSYIQPYTVRRLLTETAVPLDSQLGSFVGAEAYTAAGGKVTRDLFSADEDGFMDDAALVRRLAIEKLEKKAAELRPSWAWTKAVLDPEYGSMAQYGRVRPQPAELPPEIAAEIENIEQRLGELEETPEDSWTEELMQEAAQLEERRDQLGETAEGLAVPQWGGPAGLFLANLMVLLFSWIAGDQFLDWGWRVPFWLSIVMVGIGLYIRLGILETPTFTRIVEERRVERTPVLEVLKRQPKLVALTALARTGQQGPFYIFAAFIFTYGTTVLHSTRNLLLAAVMVATMLSAVTIPLAGHISDRVGRKRMYLIGIAAIGMFSFVYFALLNTAIPAVIFFAIILSFIPHDMAYGPQAALIAECFPPRLRYSGSSLGFHLASIIAGGPAPLIATALLAWTGSGYSIALYILVSAVISIAATVPLPDYTNRDISEEPAYGSAPVGSAVPVEASPGD
jgi:MFS family permease